MIILKLVANFTTLVYLEKFWLRPWLCWIIQKTINWSTIVKNDSTFFRNQIAVFDPKIQLIQIRNHHVDWEVHVAVGVIWPVMDATQSCFRGEFHVNSKQLIGRKLTQEIAFATRVASYFKQWSQIESWSRSKVGLGYSRFEIKKLRLLRWSRRLLHWAIRCRRSFKM